MANSFFDINKGITVTPQTTTPTSLTNGDLWYDSTNGFQFYQAGTTMPLAAGVGTTGGLTPVYVSGTSQTMASGNAYIVDNASLVTLTLPSTAARGDKMAIIGKGTGGWIVSQGSGQYIVVGSSTSGTGTAGSISSAQYRSCVEMVCTIANTEFEVVNNEGTVTVTIGKVSGYAAGGNTSRSEVDAVAYSTDTVSNLGNILSYSVDSSSSNTYSTIKGYLMGGTSSGTTNAIETLVFNSNTSATLVAVLSGSRTGTSGGGYSTTKAYEFGGFISGTTNSSVIDSLIFSGESYQAVSATLGQAVNIMGNAQTTTKIYLAGGQFGAGTTATANIQAFTISGESIATLGASLSTNIQGTSGVYSSTKGYYLGGFIYGSGVIATINVLTFSGETTTTLGTSLSTTTDQAATSSSTTKGYMMGGYNGSSALATAIALTFSGETQATLGTSLGNARYNVSGF